MLNWARAHVSWSASQWRSAGGQWRLVGFDFVWKVTLEDCSCGGTRVPPFILFLSLKEAKLVGPVYLCEQNIRFPVVVVVSCPPGPRSDQVHDTMSLQQLHKSFALPTPQLPRRGANAVNDMGRRSRTGTRARRKSFFLIDEFSAFNVSTTQPGQCSLSGSCAYGL
ncbi:hypothetical protein AVEN_232334-1 [Araneus ventricosus]|uniref:Uncharacterized protein n=1 Tax=Araneus ventricosus TaxID=182803 RepID=A0A4Y2I8Q1_ARAVE|nr:hypothetical protein AVEN_232334-1 [Araneus ventricosus]